MSFHRKIYRGDAHSICNLRYRIPHEIPVKFHNGASYDYHFIIKELAEEFEGGDFECLAENSERYISFSVPIKKETINDNKEPITYKIKFIDTYRFMRGSLAAHVDNLSEVNNKYCRSCEKRKNIKSECKFIGFRNNRLNYRCKECNRTSAKPINDLNKKFPNTYKFCNGDDNKFILLLRKGVCPYEHMDSWEKFDEISILDKEAFYNELNKECITDEDYAHYKKVFKEYCKNVGDYHDLYVQSDTLCLLIFLKILEICVLKYVGLIHHIVIQHLD